MNGAEALIDTLVRSGIELCLANPGTSEMQLVSAIDKVPGMRPVLALFEGVVTGAADGYARMAGKPACTLLHLGPGLANGIANLHNAQKAFSPVINVVGDHATYHRQYDTPLNADLEGMARPVSHWLESARTPAALAELRPAFRAGGTVTAGNASTINDGAAAVLLTHRQLAEDLGLDPLARVVAQSVSGIEPSLVMMAPLEAIGRVARKAGWDLGEVDLFEINEAFSAQSVALIRELGLDPARVNVNGGAIALGHPIGASGARVLVTLLYELRRRNRSRGIAALCLGGGNAVALAVEREATR